MVYNHRKFCVFLKLQIFLFYRTPNNLGRAWITTGESTLLTFQMQQDHLLEDVFNFDDSGFVNDLPISPIKIIFDSDDSDVSDDSGVIVISSDEFEEENDDNDDNDGSVNLNNANW